jgi:hypothetical protein
MARHVFPLHSLDVPGLSLARVANRYDQAYDVSDTIPLLPVPFLQQRKGRDISPGPNVARYSTLLRFDLDDLLWLGDLDVYNGLFLVDLF